MSRFKDIARILRDGGVKGAWECLRADRIEKVFSTIIDTNKNTNIEIHILTGKDRIVMALWMVASWIAATELNWKFVFHDDGTLHQSDSDKLQDMLPLVRVILSEESDHIMREILKEYPKSWECRNIHPLSRKLFDIPFFSENQSFLALDTDILFFSKPHRILDWLNTPGQPSLFMRDVSENTLPAAVQAAQIFDTIVVPYVNTGIVAINREVLNLEKIECCLASSPVLLGDRWFIEQSLYAVMASIDGRVDFLDPKHYQLTLNGKKYPDSICRHYVGKIRHMFYSEGIPGVRDILCSCG